MHILQPGDPDPNRRCPDCGEPMTTQRAACPTKGVGCGVVHWRTACVPCEKRQWELRDRPATIAELSELGSKVDRLLAAMGLDDG